MAAKKKKKKKPVIPRSSEYIAAIQATIAADILGLEANQARVGQLRSPYGGIRLRSGGSGLSSRYRIGKPKADPGYGKPPPKPKGGGTKKRRR